VNEIYHHALKLLRRKDYTKQQLLEKLEAKFGDVPLEVTELLLTKRFLDDRRYAENFVTRHADSHQSWVRQALEEAGIDHLIIDHAVKAVGWPSLRDVLKAKMLASRLRPPLERREAARLFRLLSRMGYPEEDIREELEQFHEQQ
jgi:SOS response regulatory protein OraA/RecX